MQIAIIGAGGAGLAAGRHCLEHGFSFEIFEKTGVVGGTWNYTDQIGVDENGLSVHSSMYQGLRTNIAKELMEYEGFPYPKMDKSYISQEQVLDYINNFAKNFGLHSYINFFTHVIKVAPHNEKWMICYENIKTKQLFQKEFDAVMVCNGHYNLPLYPDVEGRESFLGRQKHSHDYRTRDEYRNRKVLIIGAGPSGTDISEQIATVADKVYLSYKPNDEVNLPANVIGKPILKKLTGNSAKFIDDTEEIIDDILYCTGYQYNFPFLDNDCGITVDDNYVSPLYKQLINIEKPTMCFIGLPFKVCAFPLFDIQIRFFLSTLNKHFILPSREEMLKELENEDEKRQKSGVLKRHYHMFGPVIQEQYSENLASIAQIRRLPPVIHKLFKLPRHLRNRNDLFAIIDDENFIQIK